MDLDDLHLLDQVHILTEEPPAYFLELAQEIAREHTKTQLAKLPPGSPPPVDLDPLTLISLASLLFSIFKYCKQRRVERLVARAHEHPHGLAAMRLRSKLALRTDLPRFGESEDLAAALVTVVYRRLETPGAWALAGGEA